MSKEYCVQHNHCLLALCPVQSAGEYLPCGQHSVQVSFVNSQRHIVSLRSNLYRIGGTNNQPDSTNGQSQFIHPRNSETYKIGFIVNSQIGGNAGVFTFLTVT